MAVMRKPFSLYLVALLASLLLTLLSIYQYPTFNPDGVRYLLAAQAYLQNGLHPAMQIANWPFYSITIAYTAKITHLSLINAGYLQNLILFPLTAILFVIIIRQLNASIGVQWLALLIILLFHELHVYRASLMRDNGYWVFFLLSLLCLIQFAKRPSWFMAWLWSISITIAALYRIEGAVLLLFLPLVVWFLPGWSLHTKCYAFLKLNSLSVFYLIIFGILLGYKSEKVVFYLGRIPEVVYQFQHGLMFSVDNFTTKTAAMQKYVLNGFSAGNAASILLIGLVGVYFVLFIQTVTPTYFILALYGIGRRLLPVPVTIRRVIWGYILLNILITATFYSQNLFLSKRYLFPLGLVFSLYVPFAIVDIYQQWRRHNEKSSWRGWLFPVVIILLISIFIADIIPFGTSTAYIEQAGKWLNQSIPQQATIYTNDSHFAILTGRVTHGWQQDQQELFNLDNPNREYWQDDDYLVIRIDRDQIHQLEKILALVKKPPVQVFGNNKNDRVFIFKLK